MFSEFELALAGVLDPPSPPQYYKKSQKQEEKTPFKRPRSPLGRVMHDGDDEDNRDRYESDFVMPTQKQRQVPVIQSSVGRSAHAVVLQPLPQEDSVDYSSLIQDLPPEERPIQDGSLRIRPRDTNRVTVDHTIHSAAFALLNAQRDGVLELGMGTLQDLQAIVQCDDEFTTVDPFVTLCDSLSTGTCVVYLEETVRVSTVILAHYLGCRYSIAIMKDIPSKPKSFKDVSVRPASSETTAKHQKFSNVHIGGNGIQEIVEQTLLERYNGDASQVERRLFYVAYHMAKMGPLSSEDAADAGFIEEEAKIIGSVLANEKMPTEEG